MTTPDTDSARRDLDGIRERWSKVAYVGLKPEVVPEPGHQAPWLPDVDHLVKAVEAALRHHEPMPTYAPAEHSDGSPACGHDADRASHFEADTGEMLCGESPGPPVCAWCEDNLLDPGEAEWPCPVYADITAALAGKEAGDGQ